MTSARGAGRSGAGMTPWLWQIGNGGKPSRAGGFAIATGGRKGKEVYHARGAARCFGRGQKERCRDMTPRSTAQQGSATGRRKRRPEVPAVTTTESMLDESLEQSFPASDPPSWTIVTRIGSPRRKPRSLDDFET
jgi:hypothetical protein